ncbi:hypothetical protein PPEP_b0194 [Pseudoalteromonas peptidolytica F12-50-A1]|uniref:Uncharacterized protein n=1 Tax=Pseudoalteromonas peptidolytica F12-50-A1 TaxID=1315280 RepID=A0A8I0T6I0_9GAMM|nr:hypothetical protein [Pseudoalteromonas peptidolytica F12-50-A1]
MNKRREFALCVESHIKSSSYQTQFNAVNAKKLRLALTPKVEKPHQIFDAVAGIIQNF